MRNSSSKLLLTLAMSVLAVPSAFAQVAGGNQQIFSDEGQMMHYDSGQVQKYQQVEQNYKADVAQDDAKDQPFRLYAEQRIAQLKKLRAAHGSPALEAARDKQLYALQKWLSGDNNVRDEERAHIKQLDQSIANLQQQRNATFSNMGSDINAMRENQERVAEDDKFNQMMHINMFNELQSEMGAASWGGAPRDGTYNSVGGYGFQGGYGYSFGGGRRGF